MNEVVKNEEVDNKELVRRSVLEIAKEAFASYGIRTVTMDEIASAAGISKRTLYEIFKDKESLLREIILLSQDNMREYVQKVLQDTTNVMEVILLCYKFNTKRFHKIDKRFFDDLKKYPRVHSLFIRGQERDSKENVEFFKSGVEQGLFRSDINFEIVNLLVREQMSCLLDSDVYTKYPFMEVYESIMFTYLRGISTKKGLEKVEQFIEEYRKEEVE